MSATADLILERRRARRRLAFWRIVAIVALVVAAFAVIPRVAAPITGDHVARIRIGGLILADPHRAAMLHRIAKDDSIKALMVDINSPGGSVAGSEALYENLRAVAAKKPVVAVMSEVAASGGYITALAADHIVARGNTLTGSIGVLAETPNVAGLLDKIGVSFITVKSKPLKAEPSMTSPPAPGAIEAERALIDDSYAWFKGLVAERRGITGAALEDDSDGRAFTGRQALKRGLIDAIGGEGKARDWLAQKHGIARDMAVRDYDWHTSGLPWPLSSVGRSLASLLLPDRPVVYQGPRLYAVVQ